MPRSALLEGARGAGGTKTCTGAIAKQKTAEPQGAASLSHAVLESDGRKRKSANHNSASWVISARGNHDRLEFTWLRVHGPAAGNHL